MSYTNKEKQAVAYPPSDDSELVPPEVQAKMRQEANESQHLRDGYRVDNEGHLNNYAIEPEMSKAEYPSPQQQRRYLFLGVGAILFVALAVWIAFGVS